MVTVSEAVIGKWLAGWLFMGLALMATFTLWATVNWLGEPDNGVIAVSYFGAWAMAGTFLAMGAALSALTRNQVIAFILAALGIFVFMTAGTPVVLDAVRAFLPEAVAEAIASLSALTHFGSVSRGVLLLLSTSRRPTRRAGDMKASLSGLGPRGAAVVAIVLAMVALAGFNLFASQMLRQYRADFTEEKLYTISDPVTLRLYFSRSLAERAPLYADYGARVKALLRHYADLSHGMLKVEVIDPEPFSAEEDRAIAAGLQAIPLGDGQNAYFGLVGENSTDQREVIPFLSAERAEYLEYDLTKLVHKLNTPCSAGSRHAAGGGTTGRWCSRCGNSTRSSPSRRRRRRCPPPSMFC